MLHQNGIVLKYNGVAVVGLVIGQPAWRWDLQNPHVVKSAFGSVKIGVFPISAQNCLTDVICIARAIYRVVAKDV